MRAVVQQDRDTPALFSEGKEGGRSLSFRFLGEVLRLARLQLLVLKKD